jgi:transaldolase
LAPNTIDQLSVALFADGADLSGMLDMYKKPYVKGFTTNPSLMRKVGVTDYLGFASEVLSHIPDKPISFEVFADEPDEMLRQAGILAKLGSNVAVKIPITNTCGEPMGPVIKELSSKGVSVNVTAMMTVEQVKYVLDHLGRVEKTCYVSVFAGRIADTGVDPLPIMAETMSILKATPNVHLIWASCRELLNVFQADSIGCHVITVTNDILGKLSLVGKDLDTYSLDTVKSFYSDGAAAGYTL